MKSTPLKIRPLRPGEESRIYKFIKPIFHKHIAPTFSEEGIKEFLKICKSSSVKERLNKGNRRILLAEDKKNEKIIGLIEIKNYNHISIFFVKSTEQGKGIGKQLLRRCVRLCKRNNTELKKITVHSSPNAVEIYKKLGFKVIGKGLVKEVNGIRFVSMKLGV